jgi:hypothetical protein
MEGARRIPLRPPARASCSSRCYRNPQSIYRRFTEAKFLLLDGKDQEAADRLRQ